MANWSSAINLMHNRCINLLGSVQFTFNPQDGSPPQLLNGLVKDPAMEEDFVPGSLSGTSSLRLFVDITKISPYPTKGDGIVVNGVSYALYTVNTDVEGGAVLVLRIL